MAWLDGFSHRVKVSVPLGAAVTGFPAFVDLGGLPSAAFSTMKSDGRDLRWTESDGETERPFDLRSLDTGAETGMVVLKADRALGAATDFYCYFGSDSASAYAAGDPYGRHNAYKSLHSGAGNMTSAAPFNEDPSGAAPQGLDRTDGGVNYTTNGLGAGDLISGKLGNAWNLDGTNYATGADSAALDFAGAMTVGAWLKPDVTDEKRWAVYRFGGGSSDGYYIGQHDTSTGRWQFSLAVNGSFVTVRSTGPPSGNWQQVIGTRDATGACSIWIDSTETAGGTKAGAIDDNDVVNIGQDYTGSRRWRGGIDEVFLCDFDASGIIPTLYANQNDAQGWFTFGALEEEPTEGVTVYLESEGQVVTVLSDTGAVVTVLEGDGQVVTTLADSGSLN